jgi:hypothetical protein
MYYTENIIKRRQANWIGHTLSRKCLLKHVTEIKLEGRMKMTEDEEEDIHSYWMTLKKRVDTGN